MAGRESPEGGRVDGFVPTPIPMVWACHPCIFSMMRAHPFPNFRHSHAADNTDFCCGRPPELSSHSFRHPLFHFRQLVSDTIRGGL